MATRPESDDRGGRSADSAAETGTRPVAANSGETHAVDALSGLSATEHEALVQVLRALRSLRFGSLILNVHDGVLMEIHKTEKIRIRNRT